MSDIKPCPFCGSSAEAEIRYTAAFVECSNNDCGIFMCELDNPFCDEVVEKWNKRVNEVENK